MQNMNYEEVGSFSYYKEFWCTLNIISTFNNTQSPTKSSTSPPTSVGIPIFETNYSNETDISTSIITQPPTKSTTSVSLPIFGEFTQTSSPSSISTQSPTSPQIEKDAPSSPFSVEPVPTPIPAGTSVQMSPFSTETLSLIPTGTSIPDVDPSESDNPVEEEIIKIVISGEFSGVYDAVYNIAREYEESYKIQIDTTESIVDLNNIILNNEIHNYDGFILNPTMMGNVDLADSIKDLGQVVSSIEALDWEDIFLSYR